MPATRWVAANVGAIEAIVIKRILRSAIVFATIFVAYQAYALIAVPWMEPPLKVRDSRRASETDIANGRQIVTQTQLLLSNYFPKGHWTQTPPPKVFGSSDERAMLVLDAYKRMGPRLAMNGPMRVRKIHRQQRFKSKSIASRC
jgi:hypothetical protein